MRQPTEFMSVNWWESRTSKQVTSERASVRATSYEINQFTPYARHERHGWYVAACDTPTNDRDRTHVRRVRVSDFRLVSFFFSFFL